MAFVLWKGVDWRRTVTVTSGNNRTDLTGKDLRLQLRRRPNEDPVIDLEVGAGITLLEQAGDTLGKAEIVISGATSALLEAVPHRLMMLLDGQPITEPLKLPVRAL